MRPFTVLKKRLAVGCWPMAESCRCRQPLIVIPRCAGYTYQCKALHSFAEASSDFKLETKFLPLLKVKMTTSEVPVADSKYHRILSATYSSPSNPPFTQTLKIPTPPSTKPADKVAYLKALRKAAATMQDQINAELTARMEADKAQEAAKGEKSTADDVKEEDNYGEEVPDED
jgi:hypothetical protein